MPITSCMRKIWLDQDLTQKDFLDLDQTDLLGRTAFEIAIKLKSRHIKTLAKHTVIDIRLIKYLLSKYQLPDFMIPRHAPLDLITIACKNNTMTPLLAKRAKLFDRTVLHIAAMYGTVKDFMLQHPNKTYRGKTALVLAIERGNVPDSLIKVSDLNQSYRSESIPMLAAKACFSNLSRFITKKNITMIDNNGRNLLSVCCTHMRPSLELIKRSDLTLVDKYGWNALHRAAKYGTFTRDLLKAFSGRYLEKNNNGDNMLEISSKAGTLTKELVMIGKNVGWEDWNSLFLNMCKVGKMIPELLELVSIKCRCPNTLLNGVQLALVRKVELTRSFIEIFKDILGSQHEVTGETVLHTAARMNMITPLLLEYTDPNWTDHTGNTPLHLCMKLAKDPDLLIPISDVNLKNMDGKTPLQLGLERNHTVPLDLILKTDLTDELIEMIPF